MPRAPVTRSSPWGTRKGVELNLWKESGKRIPSLGTQAGGSRVPNGDEAGGEMGGCQGHFEASSCTSCPLPVNLSWDTMDPCPPRAPPSSEGCLGSSPPSSPGTLAPQPPPRLGRHLLIDGNGVPYMYTVRLDEDQPQRKLEAPQGEAAGAVGAPAQGYTCPECFQVFKSPLYLKRHGISHSDLRPYVCGVCAKTFKRSSSLCQHRLTHRTRNSRAHACPLCPRRFLDARELAQHIRGH
ncbi:zinc finger protein 580-like isoform X2 [Dromiciops gliroides]|nr:zinc finger protein 580-like isoform X2 [Dromiciops gliroides]